MKPFVALLQRHPTLFALISFAAGFGLGLWRERPIDTPLSLSLQALTLVVIFGLIILELRVKFGGLVLSSRLLKLWRFEELFVHFLLGGLLRGYAIFFLKSASGVGPIIFLGVLLLILLSNELPALQNRGPAVRSLLATLALCCYLTFLVPTLVHRLGAEVFLVSLLCALGLLVAGHFLAGTQVPSVTRRRFYLWPALGTLVTYLVLYQFALIPPVPLMLKKFLVGHALTKSPKDWLLDVDTGDAFIQGPHDKAVVAFKLVAPKFFEEDLQLVWQVRSAQTWLETDRIPVKIFGGRREGFRGSAEKSQIRPGQWRVILETSDQREISVLNFTIIEGNPALTSPRSLSIF
ncbi:MAG: DUF2914 domain-containing protein [Bacteriovoracia bacterium]